MCLEKTHVSYVGFIRCYICHMSNGKAMNDKQSYTATLYSWLHSSNQPLVTLLVVVVTCYGSPPFSAEKQRYNIQL